MSPLINFGWSRFKCTGERSHCSMCRRDHDNAKRKQRRQISRHRNTATPDTKGAAEGVGA